MKESDDKSQDNFIMANYRPMTGDDNVTAYNDQDGTS